MIEPDWVGEPGADDDENSEFGFNDPASYELGEDVEDE